MPTDYIGLHCNTFFHCFDIFFFFLFAHLLSHRTWSLEIGFIHISIFCACLEQHVQCDNKEDKDASDKRKLVKNWHHTTKGTLKRSYRLLSKPVGQRLLKAVASLLTDDDQFRDATSHKGRRIRRESAHREGVCCNNVRALFDELPTPHLVVEITPFPAGPLTENDYAKAEKLEKVLRSAASI
ncbi:hypothetical protein ACHQM5_019709 [Ranunculus cassubicifolius]